MWVARELSRLLARIGTGAAMAALVAGIWALVSGGDFLHDLRIGFFLFGALMLLLAGAGNRATASGRRMTYGTFSGIRGYSRLSPRVRARPGQPTLTASAVFVGSGIALLVLGFAV